jgi:hypothetical protein
VTSSRHLACISRYNIDLPWYRGQASAVRHQETAHG